MSVHAAFFKAGELFNIKIVKIPLDKVTYQVDLKKVERAINSNTVGLVGSCPNFPHGIYDDIEGLSKLGVKYGIPLHVDACLGGLLIAFYGSANINIPKFDFRLPGVTSISADLHKYGLCPKGSSLLLYSNREYRKHQYMIYPHFMGGLYPSPGMEGSRPAACVASSYAILIHMGRNRYVNQAKAIHEAVIKIKKFIKKECPELIVVGDPQICSVACIGPKALLMLDQMTAKGWHMNMLNSPPGVSFVITSANLDNIDNGTFTKDLKQSYDYVFYN
jgi:sphinganine-1-phosphate aldolase